MAFKRKKRKVRKVNSATPEPPKSQPADKPKSAEALIRMNGELVENLMVSDVWKEIIHPLIQESIASVSGRFTNGRYWHGGLTTKWDANNSLFYAAYQKALMDFNNNLHDFILAKNKIIEGKKFDELEKKAPIYNPFMEEHENEI